MPRRPDLVEVLLERRALSRGALARRSTTTLTRQQRRALAPREPKGPQLLYLRALRSVVEDMEEATERVLGPILEEIAGPAGAEQVGENSIVERAHVRGDALSGRYARRMAQLEVAITERVQEKRMGVTLREVAKAVFLHNRAEMSRVLNIDLRKSEVGLEPFIRRFVDQNVRLIQSVAVDQLQRMESVVEQAVGGQVRVEVLRDRIQHTFNVSESRAALIARDQTLKHNAQLTQLRQQQVGVTEYIWTSSRDERVRGRPGGKWANSQADHWSLDGTRQSWLSPPVTNPETGERNHPGEDYQCRCTATPVVDHLLRG